MTTWKGEDDSVPPLKLGPAEWLRVLRRGLVLGTVVFGGLLVLLLVRLVERPIWGLHRPITPYITQWVCRMAFLILRMPLTAHGPRIKGQGAVVANHSSWLDIFALNSRKNVYFVSKSEVANWPGIGWLARATGTVFIRRDPREAREQTRLFEDRLLAGHRLLFFPEGTSTDGLRVLPFKSTLFQAFFSDRLHHALQVQAVTVIYYAPDGEDENFYGWWGDMDFGTHLLKTLAVREQGRVELIYHPPVRVDDFPNRKTLARHLEQQVRAGHRLIMD
ncbi:lysophospholipid acyltransferase family protein [Mesobacterium sp. TK19101]|uniref:Lysophospholipid acyltransferase family protein n=1 Tax=Mesobacterium hydrothermale TaxID=3111907 RepID=A0ABU6HFK1_9RHOB|nr:lysophospholipid acyltransferase family protein [Mesobacterium sp. TK19101]MEC3860484.1 lysophospholipid acyltransferase family protein [Mesobacterium sp. TK19101]